MIIELEDNPLIHRMWKEWEQKDKELSILEKEDRMEIYKKFRWLFPKSKKLVELESLYSSVHHRRNREEFQKWFYVIGNFTFSRVHLGECSYYTYKKIFKKTFYRERCTSDDFPQQVLLAFGILGYLTKIRKGYHYHKDNPYYDNSGYRYSVSMSKLNDWETMPEWEMSHTSAITFEESCTATSSWSMHPDWLAERQYESISSVEVSQEGILESSRWLTSYTEYKDYSNLSDTDQQDLTNDWNSYQSLRNLSCHIVGECLDDSQKPDGKGYAGRFYSVMTNMKSELRHKYITLDGERVVEIDVSSAQPTFLGLIVQEQTHKVSEWLKQCLAGTFYEWIREQTNTDADRKTIKEWMMRYMYSCYQPHLKKDSTKPHHPTFENSKTDNPYLTFQQSLNAFLKNSEPDIYGIIDQCKRHPVFRDDKDTYRTYTDDNGNRIRKKAGKGKWCSMLSFYMVQKEVEYVKACIHALPENEKFWTIHDCICVKESRSKDVQAIMEKVSLDMYGVKIKLKRENASDNAS